MGAMQFQLEESWCRGFHQEVRFPGPRRHRTHMSMPASTLVWCFTPESRIARANGRHTGTAVMGRDLTASILKDRMHLPRARKPSLTCVPAPFV